MYRFTLGFILLATSVLGAAVSADPPSNLAQQCEDLKNANCHAAMGCMDCERPQMYDAQMNHYVL
jgi:hypothetical protein